MFQLTFINGPSLVLLSFKVTELRAKNKHTTDLNTKMLTMKSIKIAWTSHLQ